MQRLRRLKCIDFVIIAALVVGLAATSANAAKKHQQQKNGDWNVKSKPDDIYLDDFEGSGRGGGSAGTPIDEDDLDESSGSGYGVDDEDGDGGDFIDEHPFSSSSSSSTSSSTTTTSRSEPKLDSEEEEDLNINNNNNNHDDDDVLIDAKGKNRNVEPPKNNDLDSEDSDGSENGHPSVFVSHRRPERNNSFFVLTALIGGAIVGLLCAILVVMFVVYRVRKKDEGSYPLDEEQPRKSPAAKLRDSREFYA